MFFYEGQSCPVCGQRFVETDDIVACPVCGAPHHRACWDTTGHCHFESTHGTTQQWTRPDPAEEEASSDTPRNRCPNCGADNPEHAEFCSRCGRTLNTQDWESPRQQQPPQYGHSAPYNEYAPFRAAFDPLNGVPREEVFDNNVTAEELALCVGGNTTYYLPRFHHIKEGRTIQWNWAAFLITPYWLLYRKQYVAGTLVSAFYLMINLMTNAIFHMSGADSTTTYENAMMLAVRAGNLFPLFLLSMSIIVLCLLFGLFGNRLYMNSCLKKTHRIKEADPVEFRPTLKRAGGVSFLWGALAYFFLNFASSLINILLL